MRERVNIATNSVRMMYNYRKELLRDLAGIREIKYFLSCEADANVGFGEEIRCFSDQSNSKTIFSVMIDIFRVLLILRSSRGSWLVFTARNILIFGISARFLRKTLDVAYFAGLGKGLSANRIEKSFIYRFLMSSILANYKVVVCLNLRDKHLMDKMHRNVVYLKGEGYKFSRVDQSKIKNKYKFDYGFVGRFCEEKGASEFLELAGMMPKCRFVIYGNIEEKFVERTAALKNVSAFGFVNDKNKVYQSFKTLVHLSQLNEGLPFVFFESIQFRKSLLVCENPSTDDVVRDLGGIPIPLSLILRGHFLFAIRELTVTPSQIEEFSYQKNNYRLLKWL
jgi:glycosyltransferase involved in cell wall biosynthesis